MSRQILKTARFNGGAIATINSNFEELYGGGRVLIQTITNTVQGPMLFSNIPAGFSRLVLKGRLRSNKAAVAFDSLLMYWNADETAANYYSQRTTDTDVAGATTEGATAQIAVIAAATAVGKSIVEILVEDYASTTELKGAHGVSSTYESGGAKVGYHTGALYHDSMVAAITTLKLNGPADGLLGTMRLYGEY
jgi:hypothetical protein